MEGFEQDDDDDEIDNARDNQDQAMDTDPYFGKCSQSSSIQENFSQNSSQLGEASKVKGPVDGSDKVGKPHQEQHDNDQLRNPTRSSTLAHSLKKSMSSLTHKLARGKLPVEQIPAERHIKNIRFDAAERAQTSFQAKQDKFKGKNVLKRKTEAESANQNELSQAKALGSPRIGPSKLKDQIKKKKSVFSQQNYTEMMLSDDCDSDATNSFADQDTIQIKQEESAYMIGPLTERERLQKVLRYFNKKRNMRERHIYSRRAQVAEKRLRIKGRFVTRPQAFEILGLANDTIIENAQLQALLTEFALERKLTTAQITPLLSSVVNVFHSSKEMKIKISQSLLDVQYSSMKQDPTTSDKSNDTF